MKKLALLTLALLVNALGCHAQVPPVATYTCPATTGTAYAALNTSTASTALTYTDKPGAGQYCYIAQSKDPITGAVSVPSNVVQLTPTATQSVVLNWTAPANCPACVYIISRVAATAYQPTAPVIGTTVALNGTNFELVAKLEPSRQ